MSSEFISSKQASLTDGPLIFVVERGFQTARVTPHHQHARGQLLGSKQGLLSLETEQGHWVVPATHAVWIPPHVSHSLCSHGPFIGWSIYIDQSVCQRFSTQPCVYLLSGLLREAVSRAATWGNQALDPMQQRLIDVIIDEITLLTQVELGLVMPQNERLLKITQALLITPNDQRKITEWASYAGIAPRTLTRLFIKETGYHFSDWRLRLRLLKALELLAAGQQIKAIAIDLGYENVSAFIASFKRVLGVTPKQYEMLKAKSEF